MAKARPKNNGTTATLGFEAKLWAAADALRNNMDAAEYKHVVLGLLFLKYISDAFEAKHAELTAQQADGADPEDPDEYRALAALRDELLPKLISGELRVPVALRDRAVQAGVKDVEWFLNGGGEL
jgi:type I restriction-modification system DNA methylase subunit